jgi:uncharacterized damage-inducible protein DinB
MATQTQVTPKQQFLGAFQMEMDTTIRVLKAYPTDKLDLKPHTMCKSARELAWMFAMEMGMLEKAMTTGFDWSAPMPARPAAPESMDAILKAIEDGRQRVAGIVEQTPDEGLFGTVKFFTGPKTIGDVPKIQFLWMLLCDQIHHRGQFSIYLRMADGKVPSIYGPTADEPWM